jgi:DNA sulfur modification protein DndD
MSRLADLNKFQDKDVSGIVRQLSKRLQELRLEQAALSDSINDNNRELSDADPESMRRSRSSYSEITEKLVHVKIGIEAESKSIADADENIQRLNDKLAAAGMRDLAASQRRRSVLRSASEVFGAAVERYKSDLRQRVEASASKLFLAMTTEKVDYAGLTINENYGLTIRHRDGGAEEARSAGAEHVVALALMGALQQNAPLRGPIVMDSPFGRLDDKHTSNVVCALPNMAEQVVLLVYESEVDPERMRQLLGTSLRREYMLEYVSSRRTKLTRMR